MTLVERLREKHEYLMDKLLAPSGSAVFLTERDARDFREAADRIEELETRIEALVTTWHAVAEERNTAEARIATLEEALRGLWDEIEHGTDLYAHFFKFECNAKRCRIHEAFALIASPAFTATAGKAGE